MKHAVNARKLNRPTSHRKALFANLACSLFEHEQIETTLPKAKELRSFAERMITLAKKGTLASRRQALSFLRSEEAVQKLFSALGPRYEKRAGGYTRVLKAGLRYGDCAPMAVIELVDRDVKAKGLRQKAVAEAKKAEAAAASPGAKKEKDAAKTESIKTVKDVKEQRAKSQTGSKASAHRKVIGP
jgi:large subunit ribosomal protein L17